ncbi:MAG TPA: DUF1707 domain-containing protein [Nocardioidaceae bacterium]|nr:DUF1707 domain-containing protein [Nocardioidaceae bacterium]
MQGQDRTPSRREAAELRISDAERHDVAEVLRQAAGEGRIDLAELDERLEATYAAKTYADLVPITSDLPAHHPTAGPAPARPVAGYDRSFALMSETQRTGPWRVGQEHSAAAVMGSVTLDLREATFDAAETHLRAVAVMGEVKIVVSPQTVVRVEGIPVMGEFKDARGGADETTASSPVVRVTGLALMGSVTVKRRPRSARS